MKGLLIAFDGLDSSGKATQVRELGKRLEHVGHRVHYFQTPDYTTPSGQKLKLRLQGKLGDWAATGWEEKMRYFSANRAEHKEEVEAALAAGRVVLYDRYVQSSVAFITVEALLPQETDLFRDKIQETVRYEEYTRHGMPRENLSIFLDVPPRVATTLLAERKNQRSDADEYSDLISLQERLYNEYDQLTKTRPEVWLRVACTAGTELLPIDAVSELVWEGLLHNFPALRSSV